MPESHVGIENQTVLDNAKQHHSQQRQDQRKLHQRCAPVPLQPALKIVSFHTACIINLPRNIVQSKSTYFADERE
jgi:hypothetical protein